VSISVVALVEMKRACRPPLVRYPDECQTCGLRCWSRKPPDSSWQFIRNTVGGCSAEGQRVGSIFL